MMKHDEEKECAYLSLGGRCTLHPPVENDGESRALQELQTQTWNGHFLPFSPSPLTLSLSSQAGLDRKCRALRSIFKVL